MTDRLCRAAVRRCTSPDADLDDVRRADPAHVAVLVQMICGPQNADGEESFDVVVATPSWLQEQIRREGPSIGRHHLVVERFDADAVRSSSTAAVEREPAPDRTTLAPRIARIGHWEFEDCQLG